MTLINLCVMDVVLSDTRHLTPLILGLFSLSPVVKSMAWDRVILYVTHEAVSTGMYLGTTDLYPWPACESTAGQHTGADDACATRATGRFIAATCNTRPNAAVLYVPLGRSQASFGQRDGGPDHQAAARLRATGHALRVHD